MRKAIWRSWNVGLALAGVLALGSCGPGGSPAPPGPAPSPSPPPVAAAHLRIDAATAQPLKLRQGFLHGLSSGRTSALTADRITALQPGAWRVSNLFGTYDIVAQQQLRTRFGTRVAFNLQDQFAARFGNPLVVGPDCVPNNPSYCFASYDQLAQEWGAFADQFMQSVAAQNAGIDHFDVFSEPGSTFKGITQAQLFDLLRIAHDAIRRHQSEAIIVAPSIERFDGPGLGAMFAFLAANDLRIDALSWHELEGSPTDVAGHVSAARQLAASAFAAKPGLAPTQIHINEYSPPQSHLIPGWTVGWLAAFEAAGVDIATRACWQAAPGWTDCANGLNGLLLEDNATPQPLFYVHRDWALLPPARLGVVSDTPGVVAIAGKGPGGLVLLVGRYSCGAAGKWCVGADFPAPDQPLAPLDVALDIEGLGPAASATVAVECFASLVTPGALPQPAVRPAVTLPVAAGRLTVPLARFNDGEACSVRVTL